MDPFAGIPGLRRAVPKAARVGPSRRLQITAEAVESEGQSYAKAIALALKEERIDEDTAEKVRQEIG
jgi:hypothetical protein